jgi:hypothetical protein
VSTWTRLRYLDFAVAGFAFVAILLHDAAHLSAGRWYDIFWVCNVSAVLVAPGVILRSPTLCAVAFTWLMPGTVVWLLDSLVAGANILPTSWGVHVGGMLAALYGVWRSGFAPRGWLAALGTLAATLALSRLLLPPRFNVNVVHAVPQGWHFLGGTYAGFVAAALVLVALVCALGQLLCWLATGRPRRRSGSS